MMNNAQVKMTPTLKQSLKLLGQNKLIFSLMAVIDIVFAVLVAWVHYVVSVRIIFDVAQVNQLLETDINSTASLLTKDPVIAASSNAAQVTSFMAKLAGLTIVLIISLIVIWCVLKGLNWWLTGKISESKKGIGEYLWQFSLVSMIWSIGFFATVILWMIISVFNKMTLLSIIPSYIINLLFAALMILIFTLAFNSFSELHKEKLDLVLMRLFKVKKFWKKLLRTAITTSLITLLIVINYFIGISIWSALFFLIIVIPAVVVGRILTLSHD